MARPRSTPGRTRRNPTALILSGALMLRHLGYADVGERVEGAVRAVVAEGRTVTSDLGGNAGTRELPTRSSSGWASWPGRRVSPA